MNVDIARFTAASARAAGLLKTLSNERRLIIVCELGRGERSVSELEQIIGLRQSALSQHLARLRRDGVVRTRRSAQTIYYSLAGDEAQAIVETLYGLYCAVGAPGGNGDDSGEGEGDARPGGTSTPINQEP